MRSTLFIRACFNFVLIYYMVPPPSGIMHVITLFIHIFNFLDEQKYGLCSMEESPFSRTYKTACKL